MRRSQGGRQPARTGDKALCFHCHVGFLEMIDHLGCRLALHLAHRREDLGFRDLPEEAFRGRRPVAAHIEIDVIREPVGMSEFTGAAYVWELQCIDPVETHHAKRAASESASKATSASQRSPGFFGSIPAQRAWRTLIRLATSLSPSSGACASNDEDGYRARGRSRKRRSDRSS